MFPMIMNPIALRVYNPGYLPSWDLMDDIELLASELWETWEPAEETEEDMPLDMYEYKDEIVVRAELPGFKIEDIDVSLENGMLTIEAKRKEAVIPEDATYYVRETGPGCYRRSIPLPYKVDADKITTGFENGLLEARLPKAPELRARHIQVKSAAKTESPKAAAPEVSKPEVKMTEEPTASYEDTSGMAPTIEPDISGVE